ncbi:hypothetical protein B0H63DRAFT_470028 [Podospora didyma]|uniref:Uncharacterized protein n=1 Tax=Podospora didyma TaxID=330526 RepID=A0AAE0U1T2_9PEZI|nr:hypothetical protein B0H63DRAFT_470028 [Podospora didyma]
MSQLSRRSRDNATDLLSLKEATNARDEDIRKSLRELITDAKHAKSSTRDSYGGPLLLEGRHHPTSPTSTFSKTARPFALPRIPSPNSFAASLDRESIMSTPSLYGPESPAIVALLEKIIREMGTREGQDSLLSRLTEVAEKLSGLAAADKVEELVRLVKSNPQHAVIPAAGGSGGGGGVRDRNWSFTEDDDGARGRDLDYDQTRAMANHVGRLLQEKESRRSSAPASNASDVLNDDVLKAIRTVKDSVAAGGGITAEVKALVRELRGEVLGMGRELGRRLNEVVAENGNKEETPSKAEMIRVVQEGLAEMQQQMSNVLREHRRQSAATVASRESSIDYKEIYNSMRAALKDSQANKPRQPELRREDVVQAVKDAWEKYKPEIEIQQIGLERDEILECLQEGLRAYAPQDDREPGATRDEVFQAIVEGLKHFVPPQVETPVTLSRDEILDAVRECLEEFEFPVAPTAPGAKEDMVEAVKEGLHSFNFPTPEPPSDLTKEDVLDAVHHGLHSFDFTAAHSSALVPQSLSKGDMSDAVNQGLRSLDLSADMLDAVREGLDSVNLPRNMEKAVQAGLQSFDFSVLSSAIVPRSDLNRVDVADAVKEGIDSLDLPSNVTHAVEEGLRTFDFSSAYSSALVPRPDISRTDVVEAVREGLESLDVSRDVAHVVKEELRSFDFSAANSSALVPRSDLSRVDVVDAVKEGLESLSIAHGVEDAVKRGLQSFDFPSAESSALVPQTSNGEEIVQRLYEIKDFLQAEFKAVSEEAKQNIAASGRDTEQVLDATKDGFEKLRSDIETYVDRATGESGQEEFMVNLVRTLDGFRDEVADLITRSSDGSKGILTEDIESLRDIVNSSMVPAMPQTGSHKEVLEALQEGLSGLRSEISTRPIAGLTEILDALQEGLGDIRGSIDRLHDKPADLTANDEILDALRNGLDSVRSDIDGLREESKNDRALAPISDNAVVPLEDMAKHDDIKNLEVLITQLRIKLEAIESTPPPAVDSLTKDDLAEMEQALRNVAESVAGIPTREPLEALDDRLRSVQETIVEMAAREQNPPPPAERPMTDPASREDVQAIETILRNTKACLDDLIDGEQAVRKDHIDILETLILETRESLTGISARMEVISQKEDVTMVESLVTQVISSFDDMKERHEKAFEDPEKVTKTDLDAIEAVCLDMKSDIDQMVKADLAALPSKDDILALETLLREYKDRIDVHADTNAKAFEERQVELVGVGERVTEVKSFLEEFQGVMKVRLEDGAKGIDAINGLLDSMNSTIQKNSEIRDDLKEMFDTMKLEFEESKAGVVGAKLEADDKFQITTEIISAKLDERISELLAKYDEIQLSHEERAAKGEARDLEMEAAAVGTKAVAEELKSLVDTLGTAVTDSLEKMEEASKVVFERVEDLVSKSDENHSDVKVEHQLTRDQVQEAIGKVEGLQGHVAEYQPKILETLQDVLLVVGQHYEHSKSSTVTIQEKIEEAKPPEQPLLPPPEKYDDSVVIQKLDQLVDHTHHADKALAQLDTLDKVHAQVKQTATELAVFIAAQTQRIADVHEDKERTLQETIVALERRLEEKGHVEAHVANLREEESYLRETINVTLREEQEQMKEQFLSNLRDEELRLREMVNGLKEEQDQLKETFVANLKEEQARLMDTNVALKEEQNQLKETFISNLREEESRLRGMNGILREEQQVLKDTFLANLREEESIIKEVNASLRVEEARLRENLLANFQDEEARLREANAVLRQEQEQLRVSLKEEHDRLKAELLASLIEEEARLKQANAALREEQEQMKAGFMATLKEDEGRLKQGLIELRDEQDNLTRQKIRLSAELSSLDTALRLRREDLRDMEERAEGLERRILEGVMDHSRVLLMAKTNRVNGRESMSRKRVSSHHQKPAETTIPTTSIPTVEITKPRTAINMAMSAKSKVNAPSPLGASRRILSLSQITSNVPTGGISRSQSVRTAVGPKLRKSSWAGGPTRVPAAKGYGDLDRDTDKENIVLKEDDEENDNSFNDALESTPAPVDIFAQAPESIVDSEPSNEVRHIEDAHHDAEENEVSDAETETLRRSSRGTTVISRTNSYTGSEDYSYDEDDDDAASDWTESAAGGPRSSYDGSESNLGSSVAASESGDGQVVLYN